MKFADIGPRDECFTHLDLDGTQRTFHVKSLLEYITQQKKEPALVPVDKAFAEWAYTNRGAEERRLARLLDDPGPKAWPPVIYVHMDDDTWLMVDGTHRYIVAAMLGLKSIPAFMLEQAEWQQFVVEDYPKVSRDFLEHGDSGI